MKDVYSEILHGNLHIATNAVKKLLRVFISSTFTDTKAERNYLMREIYPRIRQFCLRRGLEFDVVDFRWGIRDQATNDHMATEICMTEIDKCVKQSINAPSFVYLGCNRYGTPGLPRVVDANEFESIIKLITNKDVLQFIEKWYKKDGNAVPSQYVLQPISNLLPQFLTAKSKFLLILHILNAY